MADTGEGPGGGAGPTLFLDQTEARGAKKNFWKPGPPPYPRVWMTAPLPISPDYSSSFDVLIVVHILVNIRKLINRGYYGL